MNVGNVVYVFFEHLVVASSCNLFYLGHETENFWIYVSLCIVIVSNLSVNHII